MKIALESINETDLRRLNLPLLYIKLRRIPDSAFALLLLPFALIAGIFIGLAIKLETKGPVLFWQKRPGMNGTYFDICKFRTMSYLAKGEEDWKNYEHRITRVGKFLRKHRLDELPQLINIIKGQMSFVGPRPEPAEYFHECVRQIPLYGYRFLVPPGLTGWAQINFRHTDDMAGARIKLEYDLYYLHNISLMLDMSILAKTYKTMLLGSGSKLLILQTIT
jgi:lipopolysaccharide/colanic/teichoic acid biosynthesis glycosyltransferase